jgi:pyridoxal phosphate enzyme (YggS family)
MGSTGTVPSEHGLADRLAAVSASVAEAAASAGRDASEITTIVVTKFHPASLVRELYALGVRDMGENRHQEARAKAAELDDLPDLRWHFVGQLQSNKARQARRYANAIHSLDRVSLVDALAAAPGDDDAQASLVDGFVQVALSESDTRGGVQPDAVEALVERILAGDGIRLRGVMAVAPLGEEPRAAFARLRAISERVRAIDPGADRISAGMSGDFTAALKEGATHLRIGTAITGNRPATG